MSMEPDKKAPRLPEAGRTQDRGADGPSCPASGFQPRGDAPCPHHAKLASAPAQFFLHPRPRVPAGTPDGLVRLRNPPSLHPHRARSHRAPPSGEVMEGNGPSGSRRCRRGHGAGGDEVLVGRRCRRGRGAGGDRVPAGTRCRRGQGASGNKLRGSSPPRGRASLPRDCARLPAMPTSQPCPQLLPPNSYLPGARLPPGMARTCWRRMPGDLLSNGLGTAPSPCPRAGGSSGPTHTP